VLEDLKIPEGQLIRCECEVGFFDVPSFEGHVRAKHNGEVPVYTFETAAGETVDAS